MQAAGEIAIRKLLELENKNFDSGEIPQIMKEAEFIVIPKREGAIECKKHRTISIMSQVTKIVLKVIGQRLKGKVEQYADEEHYSCRKSRDT